MKLLLESKANIQEDPNAIEVAISNGDMEACRLLRCYLPEGNAHVRCFKTWRMQSYDIVIYAVKYYLL